MDAPTAPSSPTRKSLLRRIRWSTWLVVLLAAGVMAVVEIPGRRTGPTTYAHGWPWAYLERDYVLDSSFSNDESNTSQPPSGISSTGTASSWLYDKQRDRETSDTLRDTWTEIGLSWGFEQQLHPWSFDFIKSRNLFWAVPDVWIAAGGILATAWIWQRRRRRPWQFALRTLLIAVPIIGVACAWYVAWRNDRAAEAALSNELTDKSHASGLGFYWSDPVKKAWRPPPWLPDSIAKLGDLGEQFERVVAVSLSTDEADGATIEKLSAFKDLRSVTLSDRSEVFNAARLDSLSRLPNLVTLDLDGPKVNDEILARIAAIKNLVGLSIDCEKLTDRAIDRLKQLPRLRFLRLECISNARLIERLNELPALERLSLDAPNVQLRRIHLANARSLQQLVIDPGAFGASSGLSDPYDFDTVRVESLPALESLRIWYVSAPEFRLADLPSLRDVDFGVDNLPASVMWQVVSLPMLESLALEHINIAGETSLVFDSLPRLRLLSLAAVNERPKRLASIRIGDLPNLEALNISGNHRLREVEVGLLPKLREFSLSQNPLVKSIDLRMMPKLESLRVHHSAEECYDAEVTEQWLSQRAHRIDLIGLSQLSRLKQIDIAWKLLDPADVSNVAKLSGLESVTVSSSRLGNAGFDRICSLPHIKELNVGHNDLDDRAVNFAERLPHDTQLSLYWNPISDAASATLLARRPDLGSASRSHQGAVDSFHQDIASHSANIVIAHPEDLGDADIQALTGAGGWLKNLNLEGTHLTDAGMPTLAKLRDLESLSLRSTRITDEGLKWLADLPHLQALNLADTTVSGSGLRYLQKLTDLKTLDLSDTDISNESLANLRFVPNIERLSLARTQIGDAGLANLQSLGHLKVLDLRDTEATDAGMAHLSGLKNLESLRLDGCAIVGPGLDQLKSLSKLRFLDLSKIHASDSLLHHVTSLLNLQVLLVENMYEFSEENLAALARMPNLRVMHDFIDDGRVIRDKAPSVDISLRNGPAPDPFQFFPKRKER